MFKPSKKSVAYTILLIIVANAFYVIGVNSNGQNPTIDEFLGIFDFLWGNFTQGVNAPNYYQNGDLLSQVETISYTIYKSNSNIYAKNGSTGKNDFSGTNFATIINSAIDSTTTTGGIIHIQEGTYILDSLINLKSYVGLKGSGKKTILKLEDGASGNIIDGANYGIICSKDQYSISIKDMVIDGNKAQNTGGTGIRLEWTPDINTDCVIENVEIINCKQYGIRIKTYPTNYGNLIIDNILIKYSGSYSLYAKPVRNLDLTDSRFIHNEQTCLLDSVTNSKVEGCLFQDTIYSSATYGAGIWIAGNSEVSVSDSEAKNNSGVGFIASSSHGVDFISCTSLNNLGGFCFGNMATLLGSAIDCKAYNNDNYGFYTSDNAGNINFDLNFAWNNGLSGIALFSMNNTAIGNKCWNNNQNDDSNYDSGINIGATTGASSIYYYNIVTSNKCWDNQGTKTQEYGVKEINTDYNIIKNNIVFENIQASGILKVGSNTIANDNLGQ